MPTPKSAAEIAEKKGWGGAGRGQGRPKGSKSRTTQQFEEHMHKLLDKVIKERGEAPSALEMYQALYRNGKVPVAVRREAMSKALPYENGKVQPIQPPEDPNSPKPYERRMSDARASLKSKLVAGAGPAPSEPVVGDTEQ